MRIFVGEKENFIEPKKLKKLPMLVPIETDCHFCDIPLGAPICVTQKASLLTMNSLRKKLEIYNKSRSKCGASYRYQEYCNGIHNFNDKFLISIEVCTFLRNCLLLHIPIGSIVKVMEAKIGISLNSHTVLNAYLHFDVLSEHSYDYSCVLCGFHPQVLIMDLNRKIAFRCAAEKLQISKN